MGGMRRSFGFALGGVIVVFLGYSYYTAESVCPAPISYRIGELDPQFNLATGTARAAIADAVHVWEGATHRDLFNYDPHAKFTINFIYDERQAYTSAEENYRDKLNTNKVVNDVISQQYTELTNQYNDLKSTYQTKKESYQQKLSDYNDEVNNYNQSGGAPKDVYKRLQATRAELDTERTDLNDMADQLNALIKRINDISAQGNALVDKYNTSVQQYNDTFGKSREFTQGTYQSNGKIDIYSYADQTELRLVLAHELGHALSLDHVENPKSIMYYLISQQPNPLHPSAEDLAEFTAVCGERSVWAKIEQGIRMNLNLNHNDYSAGAHQDTN